MGEEVEQQSFSRDDRTRYRAKVRTCLDVLERMLVQSRFDAERPATGLEIELNLVDEHEEPALRNMEVLERVGDPDFQTELGQFNLEIIATRGEDILLDVRGPERLRVTADSIAPEAACTSTQLHVQVSPEEFAAYWNASQAISSLQLAVGANSPYLLGHELWRETRIALFEQATDTRAEELKAQGVRPRVWFGERWITSIFDLFEENVRYFPSLLPVLSEEEPGRVLEDGGVPGLDELRLHNGTVYRWNRPVYDVVRGRPHLRVENRVLPGGPTVVDVMANAAFYYGLLRTLADDERPLWSQMSFSAAEENFHLGARDGIDARFYWPRL